MKATLTLLVCAVLSGCFASSIRAAPSTPDPSQRAEELLKLSKQQNDKDEDHALAVRTAHDALALFKSANNVVGVARAYELIGQYYFAQNSMAESERYYDLALQVWRQKFDLPRQAEVLTMFGYIEARRAEWLNAVSYFIQAQNVIDEESNPSQRAKIASGLAYVFDESGLPESAMVQYQLARQHFRESENERGVDRMLLLIGRT